MARPGRQGVDYFPLDVHLDNKMKFIIIKFGLEGLGAIVTIFQEIYANGYWCEWGEDEKLIFTHENNIEIDRLDEIVSESIKREIFNKDLFDKFGILTSAGVQKRYQKIVERRKDVEITSKYLLIEGGFGVNEPIVIDECIHDDNIESALSERDVDNLGQSKVKETTVKQTTVKNNKEPIEKDNTNSSNNNFKEIAQLYQQIIGQANSITADWIDGHLEEYGFEWLKNALLIAEEQGKRNKSYVNGILDNWKNEGGMKLGGKDNGANNRNDSSNSKESRTGQGEAGRANRAGITSF